MKVRIRINSLEDINPLSIIKSIMIGTDSGVLHSKKIFDYLKENPFQWYEIEIEDYDRFTKELLRGGKGVNQ